MILCGKCSYLKKSLQRLFPIIVLRRLDLPWADTASGTQGQDPPLEKADFGTLRVAGSTALGTLPQTHSQQACLQHWGHRYWDGWWSHLAQAGVCLEAKVLPVPSLNPEALGWAGYAQLWLVLILLMLFVWGAARFSRNPQSQTWPEFIFHSIPRSFPWTSVFQHS